MKRLVVIDKPIGGAFLVAENYALTNNAFVLSLSNSSIFRFLHTLQGCSLVSFHQPLTLLYAFIALFFVKSKNIEVVLHESSLVNLRLSSPSSFFIFIFKFILIRILFAVGCQIKSVSQYVSNSYKLPYACFNLLAYVPNYAREFPVQKLTWQNKPFSATIFLRPYANDQSILDALPLLIKTFSIQSCTIIGPLSVSQKLQDLCTNVHLVSCLDRHSFLKLLSISRLFITPFAREGYGLSTLEAMLYGNLVFCPFKGSYPEIVPKENFLLHSFIHPEKVATPNFYLQLSSTISSVNIHHARHLLSNESPYLFD